MAKFRLLSDRMKQQGKLEVCSGCKKDTHKDDLKDGRCPWCAEGPPLMFGGELPKATNLIRPDSETSPEEWRCIERRAGEMRRSW